MTVRDRHRDDKELQEADEPQEKPLTNVERKAKYEAELVEERGQAWVDEHRTMLDAQWEYILFMGFCPDDDDYVRGKGQGGE